MGFVDVPVPGQQIIQETIFVPVPGQTTFVEVPVPGQTVFIDVPVPGGTRFVPAPQPGVRVPVGTTDSVTIVKETTTTQVGVRVPVDTINSVRVPGGVTDYPSSSPSTVDRLRVPPTSR